MKWTVLVPLRALPSAKSRLAETVPPEMHRGLVEAIRADTLDAARAAPVVARVIVIGDAPGAGVALVQTSAGLNGALRDGAALAAQHWPDDGIAALVGDLPALRADDLAAALTAAELSATEGHPVTFVADLAGTGTTLLAATPGAPFDPRFGAGSAARHAEIAVPLPAADGLRADVDTAADLAAAARLGLGPHSHALVGPAGIASTSG